MNKKIARLRRAKRLRCNLKRLSIARLSVHRTPRHIYAQVLTPDQTRVVASASTLEAEVKTQLQGASGNKAAAVLVGTLVAQRALSSGVEAVGFDRSGFKYHGRVQALAEAARAAGLQF